MASTTLAELRARIDLMVRESGTLFDSFGHDQILPPASPAWIELAEHGDEEASATIRSQAHFMWDSAGDHLFAVLKLLTDPSPTLAPFTCARGVLEASSLMLWLLDERIDARARLGRSLSYRWYNIEEQRKLFHSEGDDGSEERMVQRKDDLRERAKQLGVRLRVNGRGESVGVGEQIPSTTELAREFAKGEGYFRILSGVTHGLPSFSMSASFQETGMHGYLEKALSAEVIAMLLLRPATWFARATWSYFQYLGRADRDLASILETAYDSFGLVASERFWY